MTTTEPGAAPDFDTRLVAAAGGDHGAVAALCAQYRDDLLAAATDFGLAEPDAAIEHAIITSLRGVDPGRPPQRAAFEGRLFQSLALAASNPNGPAARPAAPAQDEVELFEAPRSIPMAPVAAGTAGLGAADLLAIEGAVGPTEAPAPVEDEPVSWQALAPDPDPAAPITTRRGLPWRSLAALGLGVAALAAIGLALTSASGGSPTDAVARPSGQEANLGALGEGVLSVGNEDDTDGSELRASEGATGAAIASAAEGRDSDNAGISAGPTTASTAGAGSTTTDEPSTTATAQGEAASSATATAQSTGGTSRSTSAPASATTAAAGRTTVTTRPAATTAAPTTARPSTTARPTTTAAPTTSAAPTTTTTTTTAAPTTPAGPPPVDLSGQVITNQTLFGDLRHYDFSGATLRNVSFVGADLRGVDFNGAEFSNVDFFNSTDLSGADVRNVRIRNSFFSFTTVLDNTNFTGSTLGEEERIRGTWNPATPPINLPVGEDD